MTVLRIIGLFSAGDLSVYFSFQSLFFLMKEEPVFPSSLLRRCPLASVVSRALGLRLTSQLALPTAAEQGMLSAEAGGTCEFMFPACRDGSDADSAVTSVCVSHKSVERAQPCMEEGSSVSKKIILLLFKD